MTSIRVRFSIHDDLLILREVLSENPFENYESWKKIVSTTVTELNKNFRVRFIREHVVHLVKSADNMERKKWVLTFCSWLRKWEIYKCTPQKSILNTSSLHNLKRIGHNVEMIMNAGDIVNARRLFSKSEVFSGAQDFIQYKIFIKSKILLKSKTWSSIRFSQVRKLVKYKIFPKYSLKLFWSTGFLLNLRFFSESKMSPSTSSFCQVWNSF